MGYLNYEEIVTALRLLSEAYKNHSELILLPHLSAESRPIYALAIGDDLGSAGKSAIYVGGIHAREWIPPDALVYLSADLLEARTTGTSLTYGGLHIGHDEIQQVFAGLQLVVLPCANPDGRVYSQQVDPRWRKNRAPRWTPDGRICRGVDLNRNFDVAWDYRRKFATGAARASSDPCNKEIYVGPSATSEPETLNIVWLLDAYANARWYLDIHSYFPAILHPWSIDELQTNEPHMNFLNPKFDGQRGSLDGPIYREYIDVEDLHEYRRLGKVLADGIRKVNGEDYQIGSSLSLSPPMYASPGTSKDYAYSRHRVDPTKAKVFGFTVECGHSFQPEWREAENIMREVAAGLTHFALEVSRSPFLSTKRIDERNGSTGSSASDVATIKQKETGKMKSHWIINNGPPGGFHWVAGPDVGDSSSIALEAVIDDPNFKAIWWLQRAIDAAKSVARVKLANGSATGFLVGPDILMTNNHVLESVRDAEKATLQFNYQMNADGSLGQVDEWKCDPDDLFKTNPTLDYTIVRVKRKEDASAGDSWGYFDLRHGATVVVGQRVNIIQHPQGRFKEIAFRDNKVMFASGDQPFIQYLTDTDYGTSGSPVFDDWFNVVALHNQRVPDPRDPRRWYRNQGFRIESILADVEGDVL